jgi:hypothetical protein
LLIFLSFPPTQAVNYWVDQLDSGLCGKKKTAATHKKKKWHISHSEWELLERLCIVLQVRVGD